MALRSPASWIQGGSHSAENDRLTERAEVSAAGTVGGLALAVSANGTPNMTVNVAAGAAFVAGSITGTQGYYKVYNDAVTNLAISAANATNPRIDIVVVTINDSQYAGGTDSAVLQVITGTPAGSPVPPAAPANSYILAQIAVAATVTSITNANITDNRASVVKKQAVHQIDAATAVGLIVQGAASQTANLTEWRNSASAVLAHVDSGGGVHAVSGFSTFGGDTVFGGIGGGSAALSVQPLSNPARPALVVRGLASQTGNLQEWQDSTGAALARIGPNGAITISGGSLRNGIGSAGVLSLTTFAISPSSGESGVIPLAVRGVASQTADLQEWQNSAGTVLASIDASGNLTAPNITGAWTAYTPTFTNCTSPTGVFRYLRMGKTLFIRGYFTGGTATATAQVQVSLPASLSLPGTEFQWLAGGNPAGGWLGVGGASTIRTSSNVTAGGGLSTFSFTGVVEVA